MKRIIAITTLYAAATLAATVPNPKIWFKARDSNKDGKVSQEEFIRHQTKLAEREGKNWPVASMKRRFSSLDLNSDGVLVPSELTPPRHTTASPSRKTATKPTAFCVSGYRNFLGKNGESVRCKVLAFDRLRDMVTIQKDNGRTHKVDVGLFSEHDQTYVQEWQTAKRFNSESRFKVAAKRKKFKVDKKRHVNNYYGVENAQTTIEQTGYEITLENRSDTPLKNIIVEYCIYYEQERADRDKQVTDEGVKCGVLHIDELAPKAKTTLQTDPVTLRKHELSSNWFHYSGAENKQQGKVVGIWMRVYLPLSDGQRVTRQYSLPTSLKKNRKWSDHNVIDCMNKR